MTNPIPIAIIVEDEVSLNLTLRVIEAYSSKYLISYTDIRNGFGQIKNTISAYNKAARNMPYLVLTDLDDEECAPTLCQTWITNAQPHPNLLFGWL